MMNLLLLALAIFMFVFTAVFFLVGIQYMLFLNAKTNREVARAKLDEAEATWRAKN